MKKLLLFLLLFPAVLEAQTARADRFTLNTGPCTLHSGAGAPSSGLGSICHAYIDTTTGILWLKQSGGWVTSGVTGSGTTNTVAKWTSSTALGNSSITDTGTLVTVAPSGDVEFNPGGNDILPTTGYDINLGMLTRKYLSLHAAELWVETLVAQNTMATIGGRILVAPTTTFVQDVGAADTTIHVKHNQMANGDRVYSESSGSVEFFAITSSSSVHDVHYDYTVTRNLDGTGANTWTAGDALLNTGNTGNGFIDLYSVRGVKAGTEIGPTIVFNQRLSTTYNDWAARAAIGNLDGLYGYSGSTYGAAFGVPSGSRVTIDATNGIRIFGGDNDEKVTIDTSGNATFDGRLTIGTGRNKIRNSECRISSEDWGVESDTGLTVTFAGPSFSPWRLLDEANTCYFTPAGTPAIGTVTAARLTGQLFPVTPTLRYEMSAYLGNHGATFSRVMILWYNASNTLISTSDGTQCTTAFAGGTELSDWCRSYVVGTAPANAYYATPYIQTQYAGGVANPFTFFVRSYFGEAGAAQTQPTDWGPAGLTEINNGLIKTDAIDARTISANSITTSELAANSVTAAKIVAGTITADRLNVSTLDAISANMGTLTSGSITGGTIDGATIRAGSGDEVVLDTSGITFTAGTAANNKVKWSDGSGVYSSGGTISMDANGGGIGMAADDDIQLQAGGDGSGKVYMQGNTPPQISNFVGLGGTRFVCHDNAGNLYSSGSTCDGSAPVPALLALIYELQAEVAALKAGTTK